MFSDYSTKNKDALNVTDTRHQNIRTKFLLPQCARSSTLTLSLTLFESRTLKLAVRKENWSSRLPRLVNLNLLHLKVVEGEMLVTHGWRKASATTRTSWVCRSSSRKHPAFCYWETITINKPLTPICTYLISFIYTSNLYIIFYIIKNRFFPSRPYFYVFTKSGNDFLGFSTIFLNKVTG